ncbi:hypothetical protein M8C21_005363 [Ambrosia artemisiifolia]|uniref:PWWP domain-containing protein n=1 Tax=Ambrosia artemisiifolia TaxID=4212 RepID=A0AAD5CIV2_AMBAR|nr:hypothetical protein M8C21_005363 [Ambrosia artemisiifolia]
MMIDGDFNIQGYTTNPRLELELKPVSDGSNSETRLGSASVHISAHSDNPTLVHAVEIESVRGIDNVSVDRNVSNVDNRRAEDLSKSGVEAVSDKNCVVKRVKCEQKKTKQGRELNAKDGVDANGSVVNEDGFVVMDMVWAKVKSHPWWPGHVFSEKLATASVRRLKRDGLLLVAFFGDSSYGWFDPSELIPFDSNFGEKSRQTNSRSFVTAVEDALDEVGRRSALGLSCMCRSKQNFRRNEVEGYFSVDVVDYEPGGVYSVDVIEKARESFQPDLALDFVRRLALEPIGGEYGGIDFVKNKAKVIAYRRAVYEEFDETYAQAFGYDPVHSSPVDIQELAPRKTPSKAPSSDQLAFADNLSKGKSSGKLNKPKDHDKKGKHLFKRRDESKVVKPDQKVKNKVTSSHRLDRVDDDVAVLAGEYVLQKSEPATTHDELASKDSTGTTASQTIKNMVDDVDDNGIVSQMDNRKTSSGSDVDKKLVTQNLIPNSKPHKTIASHKAEDSIPKKVKTGSKRPVEEMGSGKSVLLKKRKKDQLLMSNSTGAVPLVHKEKSPAKKPVQSSISPNLSIENLHQTADNKPITCSHPSGTKDVTGLVTELPQVLSDLHSLAHDPFRAINRARFIKTRQTFLKFRSIVFQKSLNLSAPAENEGNHTHSNTSSENGEEPKPVVKPQATSLGRLDDPITGGRKRGLSDRQEEMTAKKKKKVDDIRNLIKEKKMMKKIDEPPAPARDVQPAAMAMKKTGPELLKKAEQRAPEPTMLMIKFPQGGSLPSINELKARFARYGPMDHSATRIYWKTFMCRVVYSHKSNAEAAYRFVVGSSSLFGNTNIKCNLKEFGVVGSAVPEPSAKVPKENHQKPATSNIQPKSILKKPGVEEAAGNAGKRRVKFILSEEESEVKNKNGASTFSSVHSTMAINSKTFQKAVLQSSIPTCVTTSSTTQPPLSTHYDTPLAPLSPRLPYVTEMATPPLPLPPPAGKFVDNLRRPKEDISQQMLSLMTKCNAVVTNMTNVFGYVPYHLH